MSPPCSMAICFLAVPEPGVHLIQRRVDVGEQAAFRKGLILAARGSFDPAGDRRRPPGEPEAVEKQRRRGDAQDQRVDHQVFQGAAEQIRIDLCGELRQIGRKRNIAVGKRRHVRNVDQQFLHIADQLHRPGAAGKRAGFQLICQLQIVDQRLRMLGVFQDDGAVFACGFSIRRSVRQELCVAANGGEGGLEIVGDVRDPLPALALGLRAQLLAVPEPGVHLIQRRVDVGEQAAFRKGLIASIPRVIAAVLRVSQRP